MGLFGKKKKDKESENDSKEKDKNVKEKEKEDDSEDFSISHGNRDSAKSNSDSSNRQSKENEFTNGDSDDDSSPITPSNSTNKEQKRRSFFGTLRKKNGDDRKSIGEPGNRGSGRISRNEIIEPKKPIIIQLPKVYITPDYILSCSTIFKMDVPQNVIINIVGFTASTARDLCKLSEIGRAWKMACDLEEFWEPMLKKYLAETGEHKRPAKSSKDSYISTYKRAQKKLKKKAETAKPRPTFETKLKILGIGDDDDTALMMMMKNARMTSNSSETNNSNQKIIERAPPRKRALKPGELDPADFYCIDYRYITYQEPEDTPEYITYITDPQTGDKKIESATLDKLVEILTSHQAYEQNFLHTIMITYRSFTTPETLMNKLIERWNIPPPDTSEDFDFTTWKKDKLDRIRLRVTQTIKYWLENFFSYDFDDDLQDKLEEFIEETMVQSRGDALAKMLRNTYEKVVEGDDKGLIRGKFERPKPLYPPKWTKRKDFPILQWPIKEVARQITLMDFAWFRKIEPKECLNQAWNKENREQKAPNIYGMIQWFNKISSWVGTEIVRTVDEKKRIQVLSWFIQLAQQCYELNNFNAVYSIISGLNLAAIHRLSKTWAGVSESDMKTYEELYDLISRELNFKKVRTKIKTITPPCIPYIGLYLTDLTFIEDGHPKYIDKKINFVKCSQFATVIRDLQTYQNTAYEFDDIKELQEQLRLVQTMSEDDMYNESLLREERKKKIRKKKISVSDSPTSSDSSKDKKEETATEDAE